MPDFTVEEPSFIVDEDGDRVCSDCDNPVDDDGDTLQDAEQACCMAGAWSHQGDCDTCGYIYCDGSC